MTTTSTSIASRMALFVRNAANVMLLRMFLSVVMAKKVEPRRCAQRLKRMIVTSGYNVYPSQIENVLDAHELVHMSCVIGVPDPLKMQRVVAFVMLKPDVKVSEDEARDILMKYLAKHVAKFEMPKEIEFRAELPKTLVGKVAYRVLEEEELKKYQTQEETTGDKE